MAKLSKADLKRQQKVEYILSIGEDEFYELDKIIAEHGQGLTIHYESGYYDDPGSVSIRRIREETDEEYEARLEMIREMHREDARRKRDAHKAREDNERATYERLKKKFEG